MQQQVNGIFAFCAACLCSQLAEVLEKKRHARLRKRVGEGLASPKAVLQVNQRESRVDCQKGPFSVGSIQDGVLSTVSPKTIAKHLEQDPGVGATRDTNDGLWTGRHLQCSCLLDISPQQHQKFSHALRILMPARITLHGCVARQKRQHFLRRYLLTDSRHSQEGGQGAWYGRGCHLGLRFRRL